MKKLLLILLLATTPAQARAGEILSADHRQLVLVITADWNATTGRLQRFERAENNKWSPVGAAVPIVVGRTGLAWGRGLHPEPPSGEPVKHEGDGKAPAGVFALSSVFGYAAASDTQLAMPYLPADVYSECVDDPHSNQYNRVVDRRRIKAPDWHSSEHMRRKDELYRWGVVVDHNADKPSPGAGSCVFLHIWRSPTSPTVGCTALAPDATTQLIAWLDAARAPVLVQLPQPVYARVGATWQLPQMQD
jgi:L,D-peptidoglycan transpeptidase YkuD (ErfK/YbiS/YcfS/YnhG family)